MHEDMLGTSISTLLHRKDPALIFGSGEFSIRTDITGLNVTGKYRLCFMSLAE
jgi:hypothetical protein